MYCQGPRRHDNDTETSLEVNAGLHRACTACAKPSLYSLALKAASVQSNLGKTHAIHHWLSRPIWYCREPRIHDNDTGDVARDQRWFTPCMHYVRKAELSLLSPKCPVGAVQRRQSTRNPHLVLQGHLALPRAAKTWQRHRIDRIRRNDNDGTPKSTSSALVSYGLRLRNEITRSF